MFGFVLSLASFVFAFISKLLGWFLLTALFGGGGVFCYEKLRELRSFSPERPFTPHSASSSTDDTTTKDIPNAEENVKTRDKASFEQENKRKKWFDGIRK
jgi:hypothetical protein